MNPKNARSAAKEHDSMRARQEIKEANKKDVESGTRETQGWHYYTKVSRNKSPVNRFDAEHGVNGLAAKHLYLQKQDINSNKNQTQTSLGPKSIKSNTNQPKLVWARNRSKQPQLNPN